MSDQEDSTYEPEENPLPASQLGAPALASETWDSTEDPGAPALASETRESTASSAPPADLFQSFSQPEAVAPQRIPHLGHLVLLAAFGAIGFVCATVLMMAALHFHLFGVTTMEKAANDVHYILGSEAAIYLITFVLGFLVFPLFWKQSFFTGVHWRGAAALRLTWRLPFLALSCFALALLDDQLLPGPKNTPIDEIFRTPGAAWMMFAFGVTLAPFFEEIVFRGFLLPALCTSCDWIGERFTHTRPRPLDANSQPQWSIAAMVIASIFTSLPFALMHGEQTGHSFGPLLLLIVVSLILCAVRLKTRSLAASTLLHACYNFLIFSSMMVGTGGFRHLDKL
jgi:membrane protease YdiL (CAAX protease family)